MQKLEHFQLN